MRWDRGHESPNVDDHRGQGVGGGIGGLGLLLPLIGRFGWKGIVVAIIIFAALRYGNCGGSMCAGLTGGEESRRSGGSGGGKADSSDDELFQFVSFVLDDAQGFWQEEFSRNGERYKNARLGVFSNGVSTACGNASSAVGPFYCPADNKVYIDLSFYRELQRRFGAPGDAAQAYVIAHEVGHHVQNLHRVLDGGKSGEASIKTELQADCLAGAWAKSAEKRGKLEDGDLTEAMTAAAAVGDDAIQRKSGGEVSPETWTHGSSEQCQAAFQRGFKGGTLDSCGL